MKDAIPQPQRRKPALPATVAWIPDGDGSPLPGVLRILDQTRLPARVTHLDLVAPADTHAAIRRLAVRGAPAIGCAAALGLAAACQHANATTADFLCEVRKTADFLATSRPTAVNLFWALERCVSAVRQATETSVAGLKRALLDEALAILEEDGRLCQAIGQHGLELFGGRHGAGVLTHCNAGALATGGRGTALAPVYAAQEAGLEPRVFADETRPLLQGARLTAWELQHAGVNLTLICDNMAAQVMREGRVDLVIVGADRIAANGDAANKIGTYGVAILARHHQIPFYVAAPYSTIDATLAGGDAIPIEQRNPDEITAGFGRRTAPRGCPAYNPAFDVTPHELIAGIVTERGILRPPFDAAIAALPQSPGR
ncbi:MAG: Methylthioribose-1-phosphate isomerase [Lentisphaerae bacterium ADurb.BinA184]|nr:MAG: Methylthioribose-1-phosphate isomerase [Lentisphaerae bacterium ADurb.BinA184]